MRLDHWLTEALAAHEGWKDEFGPYDRNPVADVAEEEVAKALAELTTRLAEDNPYFHPRYAGQMQKPPHPAAITAYVATMLNNPNNHALDGGPVTAAMEREVVAALAGMFGFPTHLGHLTSSGTIANLEALFVARETHPGRGSRTAPSRTTPTPACATCSTCRRTRSRSTTKGGWTSTPLRTRCAGRTSGPWSSPPAPPASVWSTPSTRPSTSRPGTASGSTWTRRTAASTP
ncbi:hypothetical protein GCM10029964_015810 [Kibdelosporangium lantanae]